MNSFNPRHSWMADRREFPRYDISHLRGLNVHIDFWPYYVKSIDTISAGGFGIYTFKQTTDEMLKTYCLRVNQFAFMGIDAPGLDLGPVQVLGKCVYSTRVDQFDDEDLRYHGFQFCDDYHEKMDPLIEFIRRQLVEPHIALKT